MKIGFFTHPRRGGERQQHVNINNYTEIGNSGAKNIVKETFAMFDRPKRFTMLIKQSGNAFVQ